MKYTTLSIAIAAGAAFGAAAQRASEPENRSVAVAAAPAARATENPAKAEFLIEALRASLAEARLSELAIQRSYDARLREYGERLRSDHTAHATEIERLLEPLGVTIPTDPSAAALSQQAALERLAGEEFDAAFVQQMIWSHTEAIEKYGAQTHANPDRALHEFAAASLPMLREHLAAAEALR